MISPDQRHSLYVRRWRIRNVLRRPLANKRALPDFLIIGAQKAGTTSLWKYLAHSENLRAPLAKELHYFDNSFDRGLEWYRANFPWDRPDRRWRTGEASPYYLLHPLAPQRVAELMPAVRLVLVLRDPVTRAYSHFQHSRAFGFEPLDSFEAALAAEPERTDAAWGAVARDGVRRPEVQQYSYRRRSRYAPQLRRWLEHFPVESMLVLLFDDLTRDPIGSLNAARAHVGLAPTERPVNAVAHNARDYVELPPGMRERLLSGFADDILETERLIGRSTGWLAADDGPTFLPFPAIRSARRAQALPVRDRFGSVPGAAS